MTTDDSTGWEASCAALSHKIQTRLWVKPVKPDSTHPTRTRKPIRTNWRIIFENPFWRKDSATQSPILSPKAHVSFQVEMDERM